MKKILGSIDLAEIQKLKDRVLSEEEVKQRAAEATAFYKLYFEDSLKLFIQKQLEFIAGEVETTEGLAYSRGTINGFFLIQDWFKRKVNFVRDAGDDSDKGEPGDPFSPVV